uniref:Ig-like domain-containing protein n=1 Tax=Paramormyrops kingsleyae TaxID=1676925 RepID=A0A3B3RMF7_9TELE
MEFYFMGSQGLQLPEYLEVITMDNVTVFSYNSTMMSAAVPLPDWLNNHDGMQHWKDINTIAILNQNNMAKAVEVVSQHINQTGGKERNNFDSSCNCPKCKSPLNVHSYQGYGRCDLHPDGRSQGFLTHAYNGRDFLTFDMNSKTWIAIMFDHHLTYIAPHRSCLHLGRGDMDQKIISRYFYIITNRQLIPSQSQIVTCHVTGFYPWEVQVEWQKDGWLPLVEGVTSGEVLPNGDGTLQLKKTLTISGGNQGCQCCVALNLVTFFEAVCLQKNKSPPQKHHHKNSISLKLSHEP